MAVNQRQSQLANNMCGDHWRAPNNSNRLLNSFHRSNKPTQMPTEQRTRELTSAQTLNYMAIFLLKWSILIRPMAANIDQFLMGSVNSWSNLCHGSIMRWNLSHADSATIQVIEIWVRSSDEWSQVIAISCKWQCHWPPDNLAQLMFVCLYKKQFYKYRRQVLLKQVWEESDNVYPMTVQRQDHRISERERERDMNCQWSTKSHTQS